MSRRTSDAARSGGSPLDERLAEAPDGLPIERGRSVEESEAVKRQGSRRRERLVGQLEVAEARAAEADRKLANARADLDRVRRHPIVRIGRVLGDAARRLRPTTTAVVRAEPGIRAGENAPDGPSAPGGADGPDGSGATRGRRSRGGPLAVAIHIGVPTRVAAATWGDTAFAGSLRQAFEHLGWTATVHVADEWDAVAAVEADIALHLFGSRIPTVRPGQISVLWVISHPDRVTARLCSAYDVVFVASDSVREMLAMATLTPVLTLLQATDPERFQPDPTGPAHELLFVGNSRGVRRPILDALAATSHDLAVYGTGWTATLLEPRRLRGDWVPNDQLNRYYSSAAIVLSDHWQDMREEGFVSNRVFDALACGAFVISDDVPGMDDAFDRAVVTWGEGDDLDSLVEHYLSRPEERRALAERGRLAVLARHTFASRVDTIVAAVEPLLANRS